MQGPEISASYITHIYLEYPLINTPALWGGTRGPEVCSELSPRGRPKQQKRETKSPAHILTFYVLTPPGERRGCRESHLARTQCRLHLHPGPSPPSFPDALAPPTPLPANPAPNPRCALSPCFQQQPPRRAAVPRSATGRSPSARAPAAPPVAMRTAIAAACWRLAGRPPPTARPH